MPCCSVTFVDLGLSRALPSSSPRPSLKLSPAQRAFVDANKPSDGRRATELPAGAVRVESRGEELIAAVLEAKKRGVRLQESSRKQGMLKRRTWLLDGGDSSPGGSFKDVTAAAGSWRD
ncbi:hypothetical protein GUITHDRAFT_107747 [Guillardia theta CCMP2712]|uniref:Uncharacterized protein n=1 Tax=Guillardia theta (strain CCMP2712) TaxID=905079 RepID=L1JDC4_GUITC|nr:hypothetical protein GUITHDRAFT_107747 [Guillardia theta CCMP2712]EKX46543.1 hypothetical protein GUITHDRAFT_107747 [Guillardia theta CCMP2712]|eukprot:XP_005833523.1 hypothetical protein GUITHDRAFT_107747 [Guillardia theta CCMP2712]